MESSIEIAKVSQRQDHSLAIEFADGTEMKLSPLLLTALKKLYVHHEKRAQHASHAMMAGQLLDSPVMALDS
jgi:hypothetical protein